MAVSHAHADIIVDLANMFPADLSHTSDQLLLVSKIADLIIERENAAHTVGHAEGYVAQHAAHELIQEQLQASVARRVRDAWEAGYREGHEDGKEGRFHQVDGTE